MSFTYDDPVTVRRDGVRLLCGDIDPGQALLQDEEYDFLFSLWPDQPSPYLLAAHACETIAAKLAREIDISADSQSVGANALQQKYLTLAERLRTEGSGAFPGAVWVGGLDIWQPLDPGVVPPAFGTQMHDNPSAGVQDLGDVNSGYPFADAPEFPWWP